jgi:hypothetical protein
MLSLSMVEKIDRLLKDGRLSQRRIAARLGVSRGIVGAIASGRRGLHGKPEAGCDSENFAGGVERGLTGSVAQRCPQCGHRVYAPCLICRARRQRQRQKFRGIAESGGCLRDRSQPGPAAVRRRRGPQVRASRARVA